MIPSRRAVRTWPLLDHLGSTVGMTDNAGNVVSRQDYWPYGTTRSVQTYAPVTQTDKLYTGQQQEAGDAALGLYNYKARFYSTTLGRFVSVDLVISDTYDPQAWNGYSYVEDNPLGRVDPTGERLCDVDNCNGSDQGSGPGNADQTPYNGGSAPCNATCVQLQQLAAGGQAAINQALEVAAWQAFHPGECWGCQPTSLPDAGSGTQPSNAPSPCWCVPVPSVPVDYDAIGNDISTHIHNLGHNLGAALGSLFNSDGGTDAGVGPDGEEAEPVPSPGEAQRKPGNSGQFKGTDALRKQNNQARDAAKEAGLNADQERELHDEISGQGLDYQEILEVARQIKQGNK